MNALYKEKGQAVPGAPSLSEFLNLAYSLPTLSDCHRRTGLSSERHRFSISNLEAKHYYHELHSKPVLIARTGTDT